MEKVAFGEGCQRTKRGGITEMIWEKVPTTWSSKEEKVESSEEQKAEASGGAEGTKIYEQGCIRL